MESEIQLNDSNKLIVYRCIQEIVNNAVKHSEANEIKVNFSQTERLFKFLIIDNGKGFEPSNTHNNGMGLMNIADRISLIKGKLEINSIIGEGTQIILTVPKTR